MCIHMAGLITIGASTCYELAGDAFTHARINFTVVSLRRITHVCVSCVLFCKSNMSSTCLWPGLASKLCPLGALFVPCCSFMSKGEQALCLHFCLVNVWVRLCIVLFSFQSQPANWSSGVKGVCLAAHLHSHF